MQERFNHEILETYEKGYPPKLSIIVGARGCWIVCLCCSGIRIAEDVLKVDADDEGVGGDDSADAFRYLVATRSRVVHQRKLRGL